MKKIPIAILQEGSTLRLKIVNNSTIAAQYDHKAQKFVFDRPEELKNYALYLYFTTKNNEVMTANIGTGNEYILTNALTQTMRLGVQVAFKKGSDFRMGANSLSFSLTASSKNGETPEPLPDPVADLIDKAVTDGRFDAVKSNLILSNKVGVDVAEIHIPSGGTGGTSDHNKLNNRDSPDQHPIGAITDLEDTLDSLADELSEITSFPEAPDDGKLYGRKDGAWAEVTTAGGGDDLEERVETLEEKVETLGDTIASVDFPRFLRVFRVLSAPLRFASMTWDDVAFFLAEDNWYDIFAERDTKPFLLTNGQELVFEIVGKNHDNRADGGGKAQLSLLLKYLDPVQRRWGVTNTTGGFGASEVFSYLHYEVLPLLPDEIRALVTTVNKPTTKGVLNYEIEQVPCDIWLPSRSEVGGVSDSEEGARYPIFVEGTASAANAARVKTVMGTNFADSWWLRSPATATNQAYRVVSGGSVNVSPITSALGLCWGICISSK